MFYHLRPRSSSSSIASSETSFTSDNSHIPTTTRPTLAVLRELVVHDLDDIHSVDFNYRRTTQRAPFRIPRPILTIPHPIVHLPTNNSLSTFDQRPIHLHQPSRSPTPSLFTYHSERPVYQNVPSGPTPPPPLPPPPPRPPINTQHQMEPPLSPPPPPSPIIRQFIPIPVARPIKQKKVLYEKPSGLFTTLCAGGFNTIVVLIYLTLVLALPIAKLTLGILYINECPVNTNIPLYMIISGACGLAIIIFLLLSSACTYCRYDSVRRKSTHRFLICTISLSRGMQGVLATFLFIWFFFGNIWVFNARYRVRTDKPNDKSNYCHPTLYWFAFYILIFTYVYAILTCCLKFCVNFFCCGAFDRWHKGFS